MQCSLNSTAFYIILLLYGCVFIIFSLLPACVSERYGSSDLSDYSNYSDTGQGQLSWNGLGKGLSLVLNARSLQLKDFLGGSGWLFWGNRWHIGLLEEVGISWPPCKVLPYKCSYPLHGETLTCFLPYVTCSIQKVTHSLQMDLGGSGCLTPVVVLLNPIL